MLELLSAVLVEPVPVAVVLPIEVARRARNPLALLNRRWPSNPLALTVGACYCSSHLFYSQIKLLRPLPGLADSLF